MTESWQAPYIKVLEGLSSLDSLPDAPYRWESINKDEQARFIDWAVQNEVDCIAQHLLYVQGPRENLRLVHHLVNLALYTIEEDLNETLPVLQLCMDEYLVFFRYTSADTNQYLACLSEVIEETNFILGSVDKPKLPGLL